MKNISTEVNKKLYTQTFENLKKQGIEIDFNTVEAIIKSKWEFLAYVIRFGQRESYRDKYLGNWGVKRWRAAIRERKYLTDEEKEEVNKIPEALDQFAWLENHHKEYHENLKYIKNKMYFPVIMTDKKGKETEFKTLKECSEAINILPIHIYIACSKKTSTKKGYKFKFNKIDGDQKQANSESTES